MSDGLSKAAVGSSAPLSLGEVRLTTVIDYNLGVFGRLLAHDETSLTLEARAIDPAVGFAFRPQDDSHSRLLGTHVLRAVSKTRFAERARELFRLAREEADRLEDEFYDLDPGGMHAAPFFQLVFGDERSSF